MTDPSAPRGSPFEALTAFLALGLTAFGGPIAHLAYFRRAFVEKRRWLDEAAYAELLAVSQVIPGPSSSQVGFAIGLRRAGLAGGLAAFVGFTAPSFLLMVLLAYAAPGLAQDPVGAGAVHGLKLAALAVVAQAVLSMARALCRGPVQAALALGAAAIALGLPGFAGQTAGLAVGALAGAALLTRATPTPVPRLAAAPVSRAVAAACLCAFAVLLAAGPVMARAGGDAGALFDAFYRSGALVFGGGHVVVPLLSEAVVSPGWISQDAFLQGYGAVQAMPGPLFVVAAFLGARIGGPAAAALATAAIFLPGLLLMAGVMPWWRGLMRRAALRGAVGGIGAVVVGLLAAALYDPVFTGSVSSKADLAVALAGFALLAGLKAPPIGVVALSAAAGAALAV